MSSRGRVVKPSLALWTLVAVADAALLTASVGLLTVLLALVGLATVAVVAVAAVAAYQVVGRHHDGERDTVKSCGSAGWPAVRTVSRLPSCVDHRAD
ncbi:hypothetical protein ACN27F_12695 [Solwaraspora sp. WMMB335]|uniref:hypothetical protein n=1 Tax=Solwaraspora sp. WMMB335 TaxID=3404118 RepID=UPI003B932FDC